MKLKEYLVEEANIGGFRGFKIRVLTEPLKNPSFHFGNAEYEVVLSIRDLSILEWKKNTKDIKFIPSKDMKDLRKWLDQPNKVDNGRTNRNGIQFAWNIINVNQ